MNPTYFLTHLQTPPAHTILPRAGAARLLVVRRRPSRSRLGVKRLWTGVERSVVLSLRKVGPPTRMRRPVRGFLT
jgi:hypothetical protein